jgi:hypothetical protein
VRGVRPEIVFDLPAGHCGLRARPSSLNCWAVYGIWYGSASVIWEE